MKQTTQIFLEGESSTLMQAIVSNDENGKS